MNALAVTVLCLQGRGCWICRTGKWPNRRAGKCRTWQLNYIATKSPGYIAYKWLWPGPFMWPKHSHTDILTRQLTSRLPKLVHNFGHHTDVHWDGANRSMHVGCCQSCTGDLKSCKPQFTKLRGWDTAESILNINGKSRQRLRSAC